MQLYWLKYKTTYLLLLHLGNNAGKIYGIISNHITDLEARIMRQNIIKLNNLDLGGKIEWFKEYCPNGYKRGFRTLKQQSCEIVRTHEIRP